MRRLRIFISEEFWVTLFSLVLLGFSYGPLVLNYLTPPPQGKVFLGSFGFPPDFWGNIIGYQEGRLGHWFFTHKITSTIPAPPTFPKIEYRILGHLSRYFPFDPIVFFHLCRFVLSIVFLAISYHLIARILKNKAQRIAAFALAIFSTGFGSKGQLISVYWTPLSVFQRSAYYPHYLFAFIFLFAAILNLSNALTKKSLSSLFLASSLGFFVSLIHAPNMISLYFSLFFYIIILISNSWQKMAFKTWLYKIVYLGIFSLISLLPIIYLYLLNQSYPWSLLAKNDLKFDLTQVVNLPLFLSGIGLTLILGIWGAILLIGQKSDLAWLLAPWSVVYILGFYLVNKITPYNSQRFLQTPFFIVLGLLSVFSLEKISVWLSHRLKLTKEKIFLVATFFVLLTSLPSYKKSFLLNLENFRWAGDYLYYTSRENLAAVRWLGKNTKEPEIVLADKVNGELIAALAGNFPFFNIHATELDNFYQLEDTVRRFFQQKDKPEKAKKFLTDNRISYIFWADQEKKLSLNDLLTYPFLTKVYENPKATIFKIKTNEKN